MPITINEAVEEIRALPEDFGGFMRLSQLCDLLNTRYAGLDVSGMLTYEVMLEAGFVEAEIEKIEEVVGQSESAQLRELRNALCGKQKQTEILDKALVPIAWNEPEVLVYDHDEYYVLTWGEYGCGLRGTFRDLIDPAHYTPGEYIRMMSGEVRQSIV